MPKKAAKSSSGIQVPKEEQWRLVNESKILEKAAHSVPQSYEKEDLPLAEEIFNAVTYIIPFSFLLLMMEILIHFQYGRSPSFQALWDRMLPGVPLLSLFVFYTMRFKQTRRMQLFLFLIACFVGPRLIYLMNRANWLVNMKQSPPLATIWVYTIVQLDLGPAVLNLVIAAVYTWLKGFKLRF